MHTEKIKIFDEYAKSKGFDDWSDLKSECDENLMTEDEFLTFMFEACDLVQKEHQERIAESITKSEFQKGHYVDTSSILSENNLIK